MKKSIIFFILLSFLFIINNSFSQIEMAITPSTGPSKRVIVNKIKKMNCYGVNKTMLINKGINFYYYSTYEGKGQDEVYLDNNNIDLYLNQNNKPIIVFDQKQKKKAFDTKRCYFSIIFDDINSKANIKCLYEEDILTLNLSNTVNAFKKNKDNFSETIKEEIVLNINPPVYIYKGYSTLNRRNIDESKYFLVIETFFPKTFLELYSLLTEKLITEKLNKSIIHNYDQMMMQEIKKIKLLLPKDEFETDEQYKIRINKGNKKKMRIENKYEKLKSKFAEIAHTRLQEKINNSLINTTVKIENIGRYDAEQQTFPITINNTTKEIFIPLNNAKSFKEKKDQILVFGKQQLNSDGETYKIFDIIIINPITKDSIPF